MAIYSDTLSDLKYSQGIVSFKLSPSDHPNQVESIHIPFSDLKAMVFLLFSEVSNIEQVHRNWIAEQTRLFADAPPSPNPLPQPGRDVIGLKIGSV